MPDARETAAPATPTGYADEGKRKIKMNRPKTEMR
jgi:hypothetical protein